MRHLTTVGALAAVITGAWAHVATADITAEEAWTSMRDLLTGSGYAVSAEEQRQGDTLVVSDLTFSMPAGTTTGATTIDFGTLRFTETGDGTVTVDMPDVLPITSIVEDPSFSGAVTVQIDMTQTGASLVVSGTPDAITQTYAADSVSMILAEFKGPDDSLPPDAFTMDITMSDLTSTTTIGDGALRNFNGTAAAASLSYDIGFNVPGEGNAAIKGQMTGPTFDGTGALPTGVAAGDILAMMAAGYVVNGTFNHSGGAMSISGEGDGQAFSAETSSTAGAVTVALDDESLTYDISQTGATVTTMVPDLPFPIAIEADAIKAGLTMPLTEGEAPQDFALSLNLQDFAMSEMLWSMFDPGSVLPRDPATLLVDLAGKATMFLSFLDPDLESKIAENGTMPAEINALDIKGIELSLVGASLTGTGDFTFDNSDMATFGGMPKPTGALDLKLVGGNALLDKLSELGFIGPQEAGSARMMMGLLAVPGQEPDTLNSKLEINDQGHILANGQRIQ